MTETFYGHQNDRNKINDAVAVCATCPVVQQCQQYAIANEEEFGVWGGLTPEQRRANITHVVKRAAHVSCGTPSGYVKGCRCDACREAHTIAVRDYRQRTRTVQHRGL